MLSKMNRITLYFVFFISFFLSGCQNLGADGKLQKENNGIDILKIEFDPDYKYFYVNAMMNDSLLSALFSNDTTLKFKTEEYSILHKFYPNTQPQLIDVQNIKLQELRKLNLDIFVLADMTLDSTQIGKQKTAIEKAKEFFPKDRLHVSFMGDQSVSETMEVTDYVLRNYFKPAHGKKYLYRSVLSKMEELKRLQALDTVGAVFDTTQYVCPKQNVLVILSDGKVYDGNMPIDPEHFNLQQQIAQYSDSVKSIPVFYVNLGSAVENPDTGETVYVGADAESENLLNLLCKKTNGQYLELHGSQLVLGDVMGQLQRQYADCRFTYVNPDQKIYRGMERILQISCYKGDELVASDYISFNVGSVYNPIIVNGESVFQVILQGTFLGLLVILLIYIIFQFIAPAISYLIFEKKYVTSYTKKNMTYNGVLVEQSCYFCKAPFVEGDKIVVKCPHVVHKSCWDENGYKCPEYSKHCKRGSHYYNQFDLLDSRNASFYMSWIIAGAIAGLISWICFTANTQVEDNNLLINIIHVVFDVEPNSPQAADLMAEYGNHLYFLPFYGLNIGFFLTFFLSLLAGHGREWWKRLLIVITKSVVGGLLSYLVFVLGCIISIAINSKDNSFLIDGIPWLLSGFIIAFIVSYGTDIKLKKALIGAAISIVFGLSSMYLSYLSFNIQMDTREFLLLSYLIYCMGFAVSVAATSPKSEHYFLKVEGPIKTMDIALYKWLSTPSRNKRVSIGKSVNCDLQMSWDLTSQIAPEQAEIQMKKGHIYLIAIEDGVVLENKPLRVNVKKRLYHGMKFTIGKTKFTYLEKDL